MRVGLGLRKSFYKNVRPSPSGIPWYEVVTENFMGLDGRPREILRDVRQNHDLVFHGVSLGIGSLDPVPRRYIQDWKNLIAEFSPLWVSDHLCWTSWQTHSSHDLLPVPYTKTMLAHIVRKLDEVQCYLGQKIYLENPSAYLGFAKSDYSEAEFIREMCAQSGCGLMLDLNNLIVNHYNLGLDPVAYLKTVSSCEVRQIHLAGHRIEPQVRIDTHDAPLYPELEALIPVALKIWPKASPMLEFDDQIPSFAELRMEVSRIQTIVDSELAHQAVDAQNEDSGLPAKTSHNSLIDLSRLEMDQQSSRPVQKLWEDVTAEVLDLSNVAKNPLYDQTLPTPTTVGLTVYNTSYFNRLRDVLKSNFPTLYWALEEDFDRLVQDYLLAHPSSFYQIDLIGHFLPQFLESYPLELEVPREVILDIAKFESSVVESYFSPAAQVRLTPENLANFLSHQLQLTPDVRLLQLSCPIDSVFTAVKNAMTPEVPEPVPTTYLIYRDTDGDISWRRPNEIETQLFLTFLKPTRLEALPENLRCLGVRSESELSTLVGNFLSRFSQNLQALSPSSFSCETDVITHQINTSL